MNTPGSVACSCIRSRSPSSAPPVNGDVGSMARTATDGWRGRPGRTGSPASLDFPPPGEPVSPTVEALPVCPKRPEDSSASPSAPSSTIEMARATARRSPARTASTRSTGQGYPPLRLEPVATGNPRGSRWVYRRDEGGNDDALHRPTGVDPGGRGGCRVVWDRAAPPGRSTRSLQEGSPRRRVCHLRPGRRTVRHRADGPLPRRGERPATAGRSRVRPSGGRGLGRLGAVSGGRRSGVPGGPSVRFVLANLRSARPRHGAGDGHQRVPEGSAVLPLALEVRIVVGFHPGPDHGQVHLLPLESFQQPRRARAGAGADVASGPPAGGGIEEEPELDGRQGSALDLRPERALQPTSLTPPGQGHPHHGQGEERDPLHGRSHRDERPVAKALHTRGEQVEPRRIPEEVPGDGG